MILIAKSKNSVMKHFTIISNIVSLFAINNPMVLRHTTDWLIGYIRGKIVPIILNVAPFCYRRTFRLVPVCFW